MSITHRRALLRAASLALPAFALASCATGTTSSPAGQAVADADIIAGALQASLPALQAAVGGNTVQAGVVANEVQAVATAAAGLATSVSQQAGQSAVSQIGSAFVAITTALSGFVLPESEQTIVNAIGALLPVVEAAVGIVAAVGAGMEGMTAAQARLVLAAAARG